MDHDDLVEQVRMLTQRLEIAAETERRLEHKLEIAERKLVKEKARLVLTSGLSQVNTFAILIELIDDCGLEAIPGDYFEGYSSSKQDANTSLTYVSASASSMSATERSSELRLSAIRRRMTEATPSKLHLKELSLSDTHLLESVLCRTLFAGNNTVFEDFLQTQALALDKVRQMLYYIRQTRHVREVEELQKVAVLFLEEFTQEVYPNARTKPGQKVSLEGSLIVGTATDMSEKKIKGHSDVILGATEDFDLADALCIFELKAPETAMHHSGAHAAKDQLLFELEILSQTLESEPEAERKLLLGGLLDMFSIAVAVRLVDESSRLVSFYISKRVTESRAFLLRLLLLLCKGKDEVWALLPVFSTIEIPLPVEEEDEGAGAGAGADAGGAAGSGAGGAGGAGEGGRKDGREKEEQVDKEDKADEKGSHGPRLGDGKGRDRNAGGASREVRKETPNPVSKQDYDEEVSRMLSWDAQRKGLTLLTAAALNRASREHSESGETLRWRNSFF